MINELRATMMVSDGVEGQGIEALNQVIDDSVHERVPDAIRVGDAEPGSTQDRLLRDDEPVLQKLADHGIHLNLWAASYLINLDSMRVGE